MESYDKNFDYKTSKLIRALPEPFEAFAMVTNSVSMSFDQFLVAFPDAIEIRILLETFQIPQLQQPLTQGLQSHVHTGVLGRRKRGRALRAERLAIMLPIASTSKTDINALVEEVFIFLEEDAVVVEQVAIDSVIVVETQKDTVIGTSSQLQTRQGHIPNHYTYTSKLCRQFW